MRLREERIESIANQIVANLTKKKLIAVKDADLGSVVHAITKLLVSNQQIEAEIEAETMNVLKAYEQKVAPGTPQWQVVFNQTKDRIAKKRGYIL
ncbi:MAG: DUF507 family protein [bacterium]|nr:DUF507 family protein [bacterium]